MNAQEFYDQIKDDEDWREFESQLEDQGKGFYVTSFEQWVKDTTGKKFVIHVHVWDFSDLGPGLKIEPEVQFGGMDDTSETFNVSMFPEDHTPEEVVEFFHDIWQRMDCPYYEKY